MIHFMSQLDTSRFSLSIGPGTTWTQHIVLTLLLADRRNQNATSEADRINPDANLDYDHVSKYAPFYEIDAHWDLPNNCLSESVRNNHNKLNRRGFNTHLRWEMLPKSSEHHHNSDPDAAASNLPSCGKFIYITRNLLDVCASFYHHLSNQKEGTYEHDFHAFCRDWMDGKVAFGSPIHHLLSFAEGFDACLSNESNNTGYCPLLLLSYERMKTNLREEVMRIMQFLNLTHIPVKELDDTILPSFEFASMKENIHRFQPKSVTWLNDFQFLRRGESGDGKALLMMADSDGKSNANKSSLLDEYEAWVKREGYREEIAKLFQSKSNNDMDEERWQLYEVFVKLVD